MTFVPALAPHVLCDVDGVVCDLMGRDGHGFAKWCREKGYQFDPESQKSLRTTGEDRELLLKFLAEPGSYLRYVNPIPGARESLGRLVQAGFRLKFVTSVTEEPQQFVAKNDWLESYFAGVEYSVYTVPSKEKQYVMGEFMIDDRADTIARFMRCGEREGLFLFSQPWNFAYGDDGPDAFWRDPGAWETVTRTTNSARERELEQYNGCTPIPFVTRTDSWSAIEYLIKDEYGIE